MLLSQPKQLRIVLCPEKAIVIVMKAGFQSRQVLSQAILTATPSSPADWRSVMTVLEQWLEANEIGKAEVKVWLSSSFVRFAMMPFSNDIHSYSEKLTVAGLLFESIYGASARQWKLTLGDESYREPCLIAAMDSALWDALQKIASNSLKIVSVQPYLTSAFNALYKQIQNNDCLFVVIEARQAALIVIKDKNIVGVRKTFLDADSDELSITSVLRRELLMSGLSEETATIYVHPAGNSSFKFPNEPGLKIITLRPERIEGLLASGDDPCYEMACVEDTK